jgi:hypothetical protein
MILMEKRIGNKKNLLIIDELREELSSRYERLSLVAVEGGEGSVYYSIQGQVLKMRKDGPQGNRLQW